MGTQHNSVKEHIFKKASAHSAAQNLLNADENERTGITGECKISRYLIFVLKVHFRADVLKRVLMREV